MSIIDNAMYRLGITTRAKFKELVGEAVKRELEKMPYWLDGTPEAERNNLPDPIIFANQADMYRLSPMPQTVPTITEDVFCQRDYGGFHRSPRCIT